MDQRTDGWTGTYGLIKPQNPLKFGREVCLPETKFLKRARFQLYSFVYTIVTSVTARNASFAFIAATVAESSSAAAATDRVGDKREFQSYLRSKSLAAIA